MAILVESLDTAGWGVMNIPHGGSMTIKGYIVFLSVVITIGLSIRY